MRDNIRLEKTRFGFRSTIILASLSLLVACDPDLVDSYANFSASSEDAEAPLSDLKSLLYRAPDNESIPELYTPKSVPTQHFDLLEHVTPARNQGSRGTCSIFSTVGLMEHLYILAGWPGEPDFSEQYLQWSSKVEVGAFQDSDGSNAFYNLQSINRFGIVEERYWPYERQPWGVTQDPECEGDDRPVRCHTNGDPPEAALNATKYTLPAGRWLNSRSIKAHIMRNETAVVVGLKFFYQSWNHRLSELTTNQEYWRQGYVTYPNEADKLDSEEKPAGHGALIMGWDDDLEVMKRDGQGNPILDDEGNPKMEKGFFIFKNSWGTGSFGVNNPHGDGFGYISQRYIQEYATAYTSAIPPYTPPVEICNDGIDNTGNGLIDCEDPACFDHRACLPNDPGSEELYVENINSLSIPDNDAQGIVSEIFVSEEGKILGLSVGVDITHTWRGDLSVTLIRDDREIVLHNRAGSSANNLIQDWQLEDFHGEDVSGLWTLHVADHARWDTGRINSWWIEFTLESELLEICDDGIDNTGNGLIDCDDPTCFEQEVCREPKIISHVFTNNRVVSIPDNNATGISDNIVINESGSIVDLKITVNITHSWRRDLRVSLVREGVEVVLHNRSGLFFQRNLNQTWTLQDFNGMDMVGNWTLRVSDHSSRHTGTLDNWSLEITALH